MDKKLILVSEIEPELFMLAVFDTWKNVEACLSTAHIYVLLKQTFY